MSDGCCSISSHRLLDDLFPHIGRFTAHIDVLKQHIHTLCGDQNLVADAAWLEKIIQLHQIQTISHGVMLVGPSGSGKSQAWRTLLAAMQRVDGVEGVSYVMDPKAIHKDVLYGSLDPTTREWTDGLFTSILRKVLSNARKEDMKRHWIVFDGDVDPEWVENLNRWEEEPQLSCADSEVCWMTTSC